MSADLEQVRQHEVVTYDFQAVKVVLAFSPVAFKARTHIHTCTNHGDGLVQTFWYERIVHLAFGYGLLPLRVAGFHELARRKLPHV